MSLQPTIFERGDRLFLVTPVAPLELADDKLEELAFAGALKRLAPNENIGWLRGQYVEAERANSNGAEWPEHELVVASLTPVLMPVTVMHDPRTAVGMIADAQLLEASDTVPRTRIDTTLGIWRHRFPDTWSEVEDNYAAGSLMQSMECRSPWYACGDCGRQFPKLPDGAEQENWCEHLRGESAAVGEKPVRRLGDVTFTGTGLIFGTRGARGALDTAHLDVFQDEVAELHDRAHRDAKPSRRTSHMSKIEIERSEYDELKAKAARVDDLTARVADLDPKAAGAEQLQKDKDKLEIDLKAAQDAHTEEKGKREKLEETARAADLSKDRLGKLGSKFLKALPESIRSRLDEQAKELKDEDWTARLDELAELTKVKSDEKLDGDETDAEENGGTFTPEETARAGGLGGGGGGGQVHEARRRTTVGSLAKKLAKPKQAEKSE